MNYRSIFFSIIFVLAVSSCAKTETDMFGRIHGIVTDAESGEPVRTAAVTLTGGRTTATGSDGRYDFGDLEPGEYTVQVAKVGYQTNTKRVNVVAGATAQGDILIYFGAGTLSVSRSNIEFGTGNTLSVFEIRNTGQHDLNWNIARDCDWISEITPSSGITKAGAKESVTVKIDRSRVGAGKQSTVVVISSNGGGQEMTVSVNGEDTGSSGGGGGGTSAVLNGLLAFYTFDDNTANDVTDNRLHANLLNAPELIADTPTGEGKALFLNKNQGQYLNIPSNPYSDKIVYSISFWIKDFSEGVIFAAVGNSESASYPRLNSSSGNFVLNVGSSNRATFAYGVSAIQDGKWHLVTVTSAGATANATVKLYVDGRLMDTATAYAYNSTATRFQFGGNGGATTDRSTSMKLDNIRLYDRALSDEEVAIIYEAER